VRRKQFKQIEVGMPIEIGVREGALEIPWVAEIKSGLNKPKTVPNGSRLSDHIRP
jgi:hypothetical protein